MSQKCHPPPPRCVCAPPSLPLLPAGMPGGGGAAGGDQAGGKRGPRLLGEAAAPPLRAAAGGPGPKPGQGQEDPQACQLQRRLPGGPRYKTGYRTIATSKLLLPTLRVCVRCVCVCVCLCASAPGCVCVCVCVCVYSFVFVVLVQDSERSNECVCSLLYT